MDSIIYEDKPHYDIWIKAIIAFPLIIIIIPGLYSFINDDTDAAIGMLITAAFIIIAFWVILPRRYLVLDSKIKIALGGPFSFTIPFDTIKSARIPKGATIGINFVTSFSAKNAVEIDRRKRLNVNITPGDRELFLRAVDKALTGWRKSNTETR